MTPPPQAPVDRIDLRWLAEIVGLALVYVGTARLGQWFAIAPGNITPLWIPSGIILATVWCRGYRLWPGIFLGAFAGNAWAYWSTESAAALGKCLLAASANGLGDSLCAVVGVYLIRRTTGGRNPLHRAADMLHLILYGGVLATGISAVCGVTSLSLTGLLPWSQYGHALWTWWVGGGMGVLVFTPLLLLLQAALAERHQATADASRTGWVFVAIAALLAASIVGSGHLFYLNTLRLRP